MVFHDVQSQIILKNKYVKEEDLEQAISSSKFSKEPLLKTLVDS
jgi:hypothetical protein